MSREHRSASSDSPLHTSYSVGKTFYRSTGSRTSSDEHWDPRVPHPVGPRRRARRRHRTGRAPLHGPGRRAVRAEGDALDPWAQPPEGRIAAGPLERTRAESARTCRRGPRRSRSSGGPCTSRAASPRCASTTATSTHSAPSVCARQPRKDCSSGPEVPRPWARSQYAGETPEEQRGRGREGRRFLPCILSAMTRSSSSACTAAARRPRRGRWDCSGRHSARTRTSASSGRTR